VKPYALSEVVKEAKKAKKTLFLKQRTVAFLFLNLFEKLLCVVFQKYFPEQHYANSNTS
jgi:hypothetical protein